MPPNRTVDVIDNSVEIQAAPPYIICSLLEDDDDEIEKDSRVNQETQIISPPHWTSYITLEPMLLLQNIAGACLIVNTQSFYIDTICRDEFPQNSSICHNLTAFKDEETRVESVAAMYFTYKSLIESGLPILFVLFLGSWSDKHGSKIPLVLSCAGLTFSAIAYCVLSQIRNFHPAFLFLASVPIALAGGQISLILSMFRYISEITTTENRSFRIAILQGFWSVGTPAILGSDKLLQSTNYTVVFVITTFLYAVSMLYTIFLVRNDKVEDVNSESGGSKIRDMIDFDGVRDTFETCFKARSGHKRLWILVLFLNFSIVTFAYGGYTVQFLYTRATLGWDAEAFSLYSTFDGIVGGIVGAILAPMLLMNVLKLKDTVIACLSSTSYLLAAVSFMLATQSWMMYLGSVCQIICALTSLSIRAMLSKLVSREEIGKIFCFLACCEAAMPLLGNFVYAVVFRETIMIYAGSVYLLSTIVYGIMLSFFVYLLFAMRGANNYTELEEGINW